MKFQIKSFLVSLSVISLTLTACRDENKSKDPINSTNIHINVKVDRMDLQLSKLSKANPNLLTELDVKYNGLVSFLLYDLYGATLLNVSNLPELIDKYFDNAYVDSLYSDVAKEFNEDYQKDLNADISDLVTRYKIQLPKAVVPKFYACISLFSLDCDTVMGNILLGYDMYMGSKYRYYESKDYPDYVIARFDKAYILPRIARKLYEMQNPKSSSGEMLAEMIESGKLMYFKKQLVPEAPDSLIFELTGQQLEWNTKNEKEVWQNILNNKLLYEKTPRATRSYFEDSPFTNADGVPQESSPRLGEWVGYQIVNRYMNKTKGADITKLLNNRNYKQILDESRYRP
ncbi:MAG: hypothetical protein SGJ04_04160 [Bacteroidota bacterium]|nr:hypothetical protein [Bacteroidota bacterium]